ncbi:serine hydrolase, partial [Paenibacillus sepulcri]|nr:serine hydrolase [Paenibacillus sepulcri]
SWHDKGEDRVGAVYSLTKSILSALIGIAIGEGCIQGVKQPIADYFAEVASAEDPRKRGILIEHLLTMTPGFHWPDFDKPYWKMRRTPDWVSFILDQPMAHTPGEAFTYNSGGSHLLSAILRKATGEPVYDYAKRHLFDKLGFIRPRWNSSSGIHEGGTGLHISAQDMAKFGQLYLQGGV